MKDDFNCNQECYTDIQQTQCEQQLTPCTHANDHITQHINNLDDHTQQNTLYTMEEDASIFTRDTTTTCDYNITKDVQNSDTISEGKSKIISPMGIHSQSKHKCRNVFGDSNIQYHDFNNGDTLTFKDKYTALLQQELQNPYSCLHDPIMTNSYQISSEMDVETMPHAMYFSGSIEAGTKINHVPYQTIEYDDKGMLLQNLHRRYLYIVIRLPHLKDLDQKIPSFPNCDNYGICRASNPNCLNDDARTNDNELHQQLCGTFNINYLQEMDIITKVKVRLECKINITLPAVLPKK